MGVSAAVRPNFLPLYASSTQWSFTKLSWKLKPLVFLPVSGIKGHPLFIVKSVLSNGKPLISDNGADEPAKILLERLFVQTQKLEERLSSEGHLLKDDDAGLNLQTLESDLQAALQALKKKEEDLQDAERMVLLEHSRLDKAKEELQQREKEIAAAFSRREKLENELRQVNLAYASQAMQIDDLKNQLKQRDQEIAAAQSLSSLKEDEMNKMRDDLIKKSDEVAMMNLELKSKSQLLNEANEIVKKQNIKLQELQEAIREKEEQLEVSESLRKLEEDKLKAVQANLERQTMGWLMAQEELKKLSAGASRHTEEANETIDDFRRVRQLLSDVRSELVTSQKALASSRLQMEQQGQLFEKQLAELEEQKRNAITYMETLQNAQIEIESERVKVRVAEYKNQELERDLSTERELIGELQLELKKESSSLQQAAQEVSFLKQQLEQMNAEFIEMQSLVQHKETALVEAKLEIQKLKSEQASLQLLLEEKDLELANARKKLELVNQEIGELRMLMVNREDELLQATAVLKEKDEHVQKVQDELNNTKLKVSEAETVIEQIVELTNMVLISTEDDDTNTLRMESDTSIEMMQSTRENLAADFRLQKKQLETELGFSKESLRITEMEVLAAQRVLTIKDQELKSALRKLDEKDEEIKRLKEEMVSDANDLMKLYALAQERIGETSVGDLAIEKLQLEAAQLQVEAATSALEKLAEMSRELLNKTSMTAEVDTDTSILTTDGLNPILSLVQNDECFLEVKTGVARLSVLSDQLVKDAGIFLQPNENEASFQADR